LRRGVNQHEPERDPEEQGLVSAWFDSIRSKR
jgi:hypothetical protein